MKNKFKTTFLFFLALFSFATTGCKGNEASQINLPYYRYEVEKAIDGKANTYDFVFFDDELNSDLEILKDKISAIPDTVPDDKIEENIVYIDSIKGDCFTLIENYIELDKILVAYDQEIEPFRLDYEASMAEGELLYADIISSHPNYYKGTKAEYLAERNVYANEIASLNTSFEVNKKYWVDTAKAMGMSYPAYVEYITNRHKNQLKPYQQALDYLDYQWEIRLLIDDLLAEMSRIETEYENQCAIIEAKYNDDYKKYYNNIIEIVKKYR